MYNLCSYKLIKIVLKNVPLSRSPVRVEHSSGLLLDVRVGIVVELLYCLHYPLLQVSRGTIS